MSATAAAITALRVSIIRQPLLKTPVREAMLALHARHYDGANAGRFYRDLAGKDRVILLEDGPRLAGFSTQRLFTCPHDGHPHHFLFSGDTIIHPDYWREHHLAGAFGHLMLRLIETHGEQRLHWFLISKGHRTYRFLPVFFNHYHPGPGQPPDPALRALLATIARDRYGPAYDETHGIIRPGPQGGDRLRPDLGAIPANRRADPHIEFFLRQNPGWHLDNELACLAPIRRDNLNRRAWRVIERTRPVWIE
jgi:hypothetical protein